MKTISLCMIVRDGEKYIERCIESVLPAISEIIIVDTGSIDKTLEKVKRFNPKVFNFEWNDNFADARNISLQNATSDYIIVLDADEIVFSEDLPKLVKAIEDTDADCLTIRFYNLTDENNEGEYNVHEGLRIFKKGSYHYAGAIHEQPVFNYEDRKPVLEHTGVRIKHYGYIKANSGEKKFNRNMTILNKVLEENPDEPFHLFNMGNQYMSIGDYKKALEYYQKADKNKDVILAYSPHLVFRHASCLRNLRRGEECLSVIADGLKIFQACTDLEFLRGLTLTSMKRYTLALDSFKRCIEMGQAPPNLCFFTDTWDVRPLIEIAGIYSTLEDYENALEYYLRALKVDGKRYYLIYKVTSALNKLHSDKTIVYKNLCSLFADSKYKPNVMVMADALLDEHLLEIASVVMHDYMGNGVQHDVDTQFLLGRVMFYSKDYKAAYSHFMAAVHPDTPKGILPSTKNRAFEYMTACALLYPDDRDGFIKLVESLDDTIEKTVCLAFLNEGETEIDSEALGFISSVLSKLLSVSEYDTFENSLSILNSVDSNEVLLTLADIYYANNYPDMAVKTIIQSIKELDALNSKGVMILNKEFLL